MSKIIIISPDRVFARMLFLELKGENADVKVISGSLDISEIISFAPTANLIVYDADYIGGDTALIKQMNVPCVIFSKRTIGKLPENAIGFFERPFDISKFVSFVRSYLKKDDRMQADELSQRSTDVLAFDNLSKQFKFGDTPISLSPREHALLSLLYKNRGTVVPRKDVLDAVWGKDYDDKNNADNVYISYLRKKLDDTFGVKMIYTVRGKGYMLR